MKPRSLLLIVSFIFWVFAPICLAETRVRLHDEVIALCDRPDIGSIASRGFLTTEAGEILWQMVDGLPDSAFDVALDILKNSEQES